MIFEEFFKKKRIDLEALEKAEPALFSEFKTRYEQMGEKSFDHTKKYWFNKLRRQYQLAPEVKTEKVHIANPIAEQTITESLGETSTVPPSPKVGFVPKFRAGNMPKPATAAEENKEKPQKEITPPENSTAAKPAEAAGKPAYQPRFKMKPKEETVEIPEASAPPSDSPENTTTEENTRRKTSLQAPLQYKNYPA